MEKLYLTQVASSLITTFLLFKFIKNELYICWFNSSFRSSWKIIATKSFISLNYTDKMFLYIWLSIMFFHVNNAASDNTEYKLRSMLLSSYDSTIRPSLRHNSTTNVTFSLALTQILEVVSRRKYIVKTVFFYIIWIERMKRIWWSQQLPGWIK